MHATPSAGEYRANSEIKKPPRKEMIVSSRHAKEGNGSTWSMLSHSESLTKRFVSALISLVRSLRSSTTRSICSCVNIAYVDVTPSMELEVPEGQSHRSCSSAVRSMKTYLHQELCRQYPFIVALCT